MTEKCFGRSSRVFRQNGVGIVIVEKIMCFPVVVSSIQNNGSISFVSVKNLDVTILLQLLKCLPLLRRNVVRSFLRFPDGLADFYPRQLLVLIRSRRYLKSCFNWRGDVNGVDFRCHIVLGTFG